MIARQLVLLGLAASAVSSASVRRVQENYIDREVSFEHRLYYKTVQSEEALEAFHLGVQQDLAAYLDDLNARAEVQEVTSVTRGVCDYEDFQEEVAAGYDNCLRVNSLVELGATPDLDEVVLARVVLNRIREFLGDASSVANQVTIYDYPKLVQATVILRLSGQGDLMNDDEKYLFVKTLQDDFQPIMEQAAYGWIRGEVVGQQSGSETPDLSVADTLPKDLYARVELMIRAQCAGDACNDDNFERWLDLTLQEHVQEFLSKLYSVGPPTSNTYYDEVQRIQVGDGALVEPLKTAAVIDTQNVEHSDAEMPAWVWAVAFAGLAVIIFAMVWTCMRLGARQHATQKELNQNVKESKRAVEHRTTTRQDHSRLSVQQSGSLDDEASQ